MNRLNFHPLPGLGSPDLQTIFGSCLPPGDAPPSKSLMIELGEGDRLCCEVSTPPHWKDGDRIVVLVHGMGGSHASSYMIRMSQKFYLRGIRAVRINLRGCGSGQGLSKIPYHGGTSGDVLKVLQSLKSEAPASEIFVIGFSLGGNMILKLAGELGAEGKKFVKAFMVVCAPLNLAHSVQKILEKRNRLYHFYYLKKVCEQARRWEPRNIRNLYEFDNSLTAPLWGYRGADDYYQDCSSIRFLPHIQQSTHLLFAEDDPFISLDGLQGVSLPDCVRVWTTEKGGHMGFLGKVSNIRSIYWMDHLLLNWIEGDFTSNLQIQKR